MELKETEKNLLDAVSHIIENDGFTKIGVNRIANKAGCDKDLDLSLFWRDWTVCLWNGQNDMTITHLLILNLLKPLREQKVKI